MAVTLPLRDPLAVAALIALVLWLVPMIAERLRIPGLVGLLVAGASLGPNALEVLERDFAMELLGTAGLLYLMFVIGLELDLDSFRRHRNRSMGYGAICVLVANVLGVGIGMLVLDMPLGPALLVASLFTSHTLLAFPIASRLGIARNPAVTVAVGSVIVTDTVSLLLLAAVVGSAKGDISALFFVELLLSFLAFVTSLFFLLPRLARWYFRRFANEKGSDFLFALATLLASACLGNLFGIQPILSAFFAGLALNRLIPESGVLMNRLAFTGNTLFIPAFLFSVGMVVDLRVFAADGAVWKVSLALVGGVTLTKLIGAKLVQRLHDYSRSEGWVVYGLSAPQAAGTLAIVLVGHDVGLLDADVLNGAVAMILCTCIVGPIVTQHFGRRVALRQRRTPGKQEAPQRVLVPLDHPAAVDTLVDVAAHIRDLSTTEPLFPLTVVSATSDTRAAVAHAEALLSHAVLHAAAIEAVTTPLTRIARNPAVGIARAASERRITDIVMGWAGTTSTRDRIFGSIIDHVVENTKQRVWVCKLGSRVGMGSRIMVVVPPLSGYHHAFDSTLRSVRNLASRLRMDHLILSIGQQPDGSMTAGSERNAGAGEAVVVKDWMQAREKLSWTLQDDDLLLLVGARSGTVAYTSELTVMPEDLSAQCRNMIVVYPYEFDPDPAGDAFSSLLHRLDDEHVLRATASDNWRAAIAPLLGTPIEGTGVASETVLDTLMGRRNRLAVETARGVMVLHGVSEVIDEPMLRVLLLPTAQTFPVGVEPVQAILLLISPQSAPPQARVALLAGLGKIVSSPEGVHRIVNAQNAAGIAALLEYAAREPAKDA